MYPFENDGAQVLQTTEFDNMFAVLRATSTTHYSERDGSKQRYRYKYQTLIIRNLTYAYIGLSHCLPAMPPLYHARGFPALKLQHKKRKLVQADPWGLLGELWEPSGRQEPERPT